MDLKVFFFKSKSVFLTKAFQNFSKRYISTVKDRYISIIHCIQFCEHLQHNKSRAVNILGINLLLLFEFSITQANLFPIWSPCICSCSQTSYQIFFLLLVNQFKSQL